MLAIKLLALFAGVLSTVNRGDGHPGDQCIDNIQEFNKNTLVHNLMDGWSTFCKHYMII